MTAVLTSRGIDVLRERPEGSRYYKDPGSDELLASVTTVIGATTSMPWLTPWAAKLAAEAAVGHYDLVGRLIAESGPEAAVEFVKGEAKRRREKASETGIWLHDVVEAIALDISLPELPDDVLPFAEAFFEWCVEWSPRFLMSEATVAAPARGHAGTADLLVELPAFEGTPYEGSWLLDAKSGANLSAWMPVQLEAYRRSTEVWLPRGQKVAMPSVDHVWVLHVRPGGCKLICVDAQAGDSAYHAFLRMLELLDWKDSQGGRMGRVLYLPDENGQQPPPLLEDLGDVPARAALSKTGVYRLDQLAELDVERLQAISGVGPKSVLDVRAFLRSRGLPVDHLDPVCEAIEEKERRRVERTRAKEVVGAQAV